MQIDHVDGLADLGNEYKVHQRSQAALALLVGERDSCASKLQQARDRIAQVKYVQSLHS